MQDLFRNKNSLYVLSAKESVVLTAKTRKTQFLANYFDVHLFYFHIHLLMMLGMINDAFSDSLLTSPPIKWL